MSDAVRGLVTIECNASVRETANRLAKLIEANRLRVFARIDHAGNAAEVGMELRPTELLIFGNPQGGTPLMRDRQTVGVGPAVQDARLGRRGFQDLADL
jgi:uncharacterized protein (DUF302 family)